MAAKAADATRILIAAAAKSLPFEHNGALVAPLIAQMHKYMIHTSAQYYGINFSFVQIISGLGKAVIANDRIDRCHKKTRNF